MTGDRSRSEAHGEVLQLCVSDTHSIIWREYGSPEGIPLLCLQEHPGLAPHPRSRLLAEHGQYRILAVEQHSGECQADDCGLSLEQLVTGLEQLREHFDIEQWAILGSSFGSLLALFYSLKYPGRCAGLVLSSIWLARDEDIRWWWQGSEFMFPDIRSALCKVFETDGVDQLRRKAYEDCRSDKADTRLTAGRALLEYRKNLQYASPQMTDKHLQDLDAAAIIRSGRLLTWFDQNQYFVAGSPLLESVKTLRNIPAHLLHGRYDPLVPPQAAFDLWMSWPEAQFHIAPASGHSHNDLFYRPLVINALSALALILRKV